MRCFVLLAFGLSFALSSQSLALTISNSSRSIDVSLFTNDANNPILADGDTEVVNNNDPHVQNLLATIGGATPAFVARAGMTASGVFGLEASIDPSSLPTDINGDPIAHTVRAEVRLRVLFNNLTTDAFQFDSSFFISGGEFVLGPAGENNFLSYSLRTFVGPSVIVPGNTIPIERFASTGFYEGFDFNPEKNTFTETGTSIGGSVDDIDGTVTFPLSTHLASDRVILPGEQIALNYDLTVQMRTNGDVEGPMSFFFNDPLGSNGLPDPNGDPLLPAFEFSPSNAQPVPAPEMASVFAGALLVLAVVRRRRRKGL